MKRHLVYMLVGLVVLTGPAASGWAQAVVGEAAPDFTLNDPSGTPHALNEFAKTFVVLEWFNKDCPFVRKHYGSGNMQRLQSTYTARGVTWLTISSSAPGKQGYIAPKEGRAVVAQNEMHATSLLLDPDGTVGRLYGAKTTPHLFVINPEGVVIYAGAIDDAPSTDPADIGAANNYVAQALNEAMEGKPVSTPQTASYGCSVKY